MRLLERLLDTTRESGKEMGKMEMGDIGAADALEIDSEVDLSAFESTPGGTSESKGSNSSKKSAPGEGKWAKWGQLQGEILDAVLQDEDEWGGEHLESLARRLRTTVEDLGMVIEGTNPDEWTQKRLERLLQMERIRNRDVNWDVLEDAATGKLMSLLEGRTPMKTAEVLAIAVAANRANRAHRGVNPMAGNGVTINMNGGPGQAVELPGPGGLGTMRLTLSPKTVNQLGQGITIEAEAEKYTDSVEMLDGKDVPMLSKMADER